MPPRVGSVFFHGLRIKVILPVGWSALKALCFCEVYGREWFSLLFDIWGVIWVIWEMCILQKLVSGDSVSHYLTTPLVHWIRGTKVIICQPLECQKARILDLHSPLHLNMEVALMQSVRPITYISQSSRYSEESEQKGPWKWHSKNLIEGMSTWDPQRRRLSQASPPPMAAEPPYKPWLFSFLIQVQTS
jgi:hypothetical protein